MLKKNVSVTIHLRFNERTQFFAKNYLQIYATFAKKSIATSIYFQNRIIILRFVTQLSYD